MSQPQKKTNYVNVNLKILKGIFVNHAVPIVVPKKWAESVGIISDGEGNLLLLNIKILSEVFANESFPIPVSRKWLEGLHITIEKEAEPIQVEQTEFSIKPVDSFSIPKIEDNGQEEDGEEDGEERGESGAVKFSFGS